MSLRTSEAQASQDHVVGTTADGAPTRGLDPPGAGATGPVPAGTRQVGLHQGGLHLVGPGEAAPPRLSLERRSRPRLGPLVPVPEPPLFASVPELVRALRPEHPVVCVRPDELRRQATAFARGFRGTALYAVKCNPDPFVLSCLFEAGITGFDVASLEEVEGVHALFGDRASLFFNNPAKSRRAIATASRDYGVRFFTVDHLSELDKLVEETRGADGPPVVAVRLAVHAAASRYALSTKFGAPPDEAVQLLRAARRAGLKTGLSFHVGSQCLDPRAFGHAIAACRSVLREAGVPIDLVNVGGGFPAPYPADAPAGLHAYFTAIELGLHSLGLPPGTMVLCEPGRALVGSAASVLARVMLRKTDTLYLGDGIYGNLQELRSPREQRPARLVRPDGTVEEGTCAFRVYGPTCDSDDVLGAALLLPEGVREGDYVEIGMMGAYSSATRTPFNGFSAHAMARIAGQVPESLHRTAPA